MGGPERQSQTLAAVVRRRSSAGPGKRLSANPRSVDQILKRRESKIPKGLEFTSDTYKNGDVDDDDGDDDDVDDDAMHGDLNDILGGAIDPSLVASKVLEYRYTIAREWAAAIALSVPSALQEPLRENLEGQLGEASASGVF